MANPNPPEHTRFKPGVSANPGGISKQDKEIRAFKECTYKEFIDKMNQFGYMSQSEMREVIEDPSTPMFDMIFSRILYDASRGKPHAVQILLDRLWGKPKDTTLDIPANAPQIIVQLPDNGRK